MEHYYTFKSGRKIYGYGNTFSIAPGGYLVYGWDGTVVGVELEDDKDDEPLTLNERLELSNMMVRRWSEWAFTGGPEQEKPR